MAVDILTKPLARQTPPRERLTYEEFCARVNEQKADLIHGEIFMASPARYRHEDLVNLWMSMLRRYAKKKKLGKVMGSRVAMKLDDHEAPEPDIMFIKKDRLPLLKETEILGPADLAIEVVSPGSRHLDLVEKKDLYASYGVSEYWVIDPYRQRACFWKNVDGMWEDIAVDENGIMNSTVLPDFWLRVDWLFAAEELDEDQIFEAILGGRSS